MTVFTASANSTGGVYCLGVASGALYKCLIDCRVGGNESIAEPGSHLREESLPAHCPTPPQCRLFTVVLHSRELRVGIQGMLILLTSPLVLAGLHSRGD